MGETFLWSFLLHTSFGWLIPALVSFVFFVCSFFFLLLLFSHRLSPLLFPFLSFGSLCLTPNDLSFLLKSNHSARFSEV